jgi:hypothetical protein
MSATPDCACHDIKSAVAERLMNNVAIRQRRLQFTSGGVRDVGRAEIEPLQSLQLFEFASAGIPD